MDLQSSILTPGMLAFIALANEYCQALEKARDTERDTFVATMLRLLPRLYMTATDLNIVLDIDQEDDAVLDQILDEDTYNAVRDGVAALMGGDDVFLETFEEDMKYSDTPIGASISENLADIFQVLYNSTEMVKEAPVERIPAILQAVKEDFENYWSQTLCNVLRPLNHIRYFAPRSED
nr:DUF5063 domain-containing protein [Bacteroides sp.]